VNGNAQPRSYFGLGRGNTPQWTGYLMESMIRAGKNLGLDEKVATALTLQTALGAAQMAITSSNTPSEPRKNVTSPSAVSWVKTTRTAFSSC
ncbi:pyrroline-5-carboxylate reductase family protein, partial [Klebsiella pneumoniae]